MMERDYGVKHVSDIPTGVDTAFYCPRGKMQSDPLNLVFTGSMDWLPNEDAIQWFTKDVYPLVKQHVPSATFTIVGRNPYSSLVELSKRDSSIVVTGRVEDVRPYIGRAAVYIVPIRIGGGTRLKVYEAMAMQKPVVSTTIGVEGLPVHNGHELLIADTPLAFADSIIQLINSPETGERLAMNASRLVRERFGWSSVAEVFAGICEEVVSRTNSAKEKRELCHESCCA